MKKVVSIIFMFLMILVFASVSFAAQVITPNQKTSVVLKPAITTKKIVESNAVSKIITAKAFYGAETISKEGHYDIDAALEKMKKEAAEKAAEKAADKKKNDEIKKTPTEKTEKEETDKISEIIKTKTATSPAEKPKESTVVEQPSKDVVVSTNTPSTVVAVGSAIKPTPMEEGAHETEESLLVTPDWLAKNLDKVVVIDTRPESLYAGDHIPGAVNASWTYFANVNCATGSLKYGTIYAPETMAKRIGALGINGKKDVVVYCDAGGWGQSGWAIWVLRMSGIKNAKILNGGLTAWKAHGGALSRKKSVNKALPFSIASYKANYLVNTEWIKNNLGKPNLAILDVRTAEEYKGKIRPFGEKRAGHLPGAINIEMKNFVNADFTYKNPEEVAELLQSFGIAPDMEIVVYDTAGVRAAFVTMVLRYASGYNKTQCYDEGFQAWAGDSTLPIEKPE